MYLRKTKWIITVSSSHFFLLFFFSSTGGVLFTNMYDNINVILNNMPTPASHVT